MLADSERVEAVVRNLQKVDFGPLIVDPVMVAKGGHHLLEAEAVQTIKEQLLPLATVVTPFTRSGSFTRDDHQDRTRNADRSKNYSNWAQKYYYERRT